MRLIHNNLNWEWRFRRALDDLEPPEDLDKSELRKRQQTLLHYGFQKSSDTNFPNAIIYIKTHSGILREKYIFIYSGFYRVLDIVNEERLRALTKSIRDATKQVFAENKRNGCNPKFPPRPEWHADFLERKFKRYRGKLSANKKLATLLRQHRHLIRALQVYDPFSPDSPAFSTMPLDGQEVNDPMRKAYRGFLTNLLFANSIMERQPGAPKKPHSKTQKQTTQAETEYRRVSRDDPYSSHAHRCKEVARRLNRPGGYSVTDKTLQGRLRPLCHKLK